MNWNKALNLLISVFIVVNIVLGMANYNKHILAYKLSDDQVKTITNLLEEQGITIACELPMDFRPASSVWIEPTELTTSKKDFFIKLFLNNDLSKILITKVSGDNNEDLIYKYEEKELRFVENEIHYVDKSISTDISTVDEKALKKIAEEFFDKLPMKESYKNVKIQQKIESYGVELTYYEVYKGFPLFNSYVRMKVTPEGIYSVEVKLINQNDILEGLREIYPIHHVLFELFGDLDQDVDLEILDIELGFMIPNKGRLHLLEEEAVPMYKIEIEGLNDPIFVNAYTNELVEE